MPSKADFIEWKQNLVTQAVMDGFRQRIQELEIILGKSAGLDSLEDRYKAGAIAAYQDILYIEFEETQDE